MAIAEDKLERILRDNLARPRGLLKRVDCPNEETLASYLGGVLSENAMEKFETHLAQCSFCLDETVAAYKATEDQSLERVPQRLLNRAMRLVEETASEPDLVLRKSDVSNRENRWVAIREWFEKIRLAFQETPSSFRWALAAQTTVIVLLAAAVILQSSVAPSLLYRTLSDAGSGSEPGRESIQVVFAEDITEREIRTLLRTSGAAIIAGPSSMAVYTVTVPRSGGEALGGTRAALEMFRAHPKVRLAEPKVP